MMYFVLVYDHNVLNANLELVISTSIKSTAIYNTSYEITESYVFFNISFNYFIFYMFNTSLHVHINKWQVGNDSNNNIKEQKTRA